MNWRPYILVAPASIVLSCGTVCWADEIYLKNGNHITGEIDSMEEETLKVKVFFGDDEQTVQIEWKNVKRLEAEKPFTVEILPKGVTLEEAEEEIFEVTRMTATILEDTERLPLNRVDGINIPAIRYKGETSLGGNSLSGNTDTAALNWSLDATVWSKRHRGNVGAKYNFAQAEGTTTADNSRANFRYDYFLTKKIFATLSQLFERDKFQGLNLRSTTGLGIGREFIDTDRQKLAASIAVAAVYQDFQLTGMTTTPSAIWYLRWEYDLIKDNLKLWHQQTGARDWFEDSKAWRLNADQGIRVELWDDFYFDLEFDFRFNSQPEPTKQTTDQSIIFSLGYSLSN